KAALPLMIVVPLVAMGMLFNHLAEQKRLEREYAMLFHGTPEEYEKVLVESKRKVLEIAVQLGNIRMETAQMELLAYQMRLQDGRRQPGSWINSRVTQPH